MEEIKKIYYSFHKEKKINPLHEIIQQIKKNPQKKNRCTTNHNNNKTNNNNINLIPHKKINNNNKIKKKNLKNIKIQIFDKILPNQKNTNRTKNISISTLSNTNNNSTLSKKTGIIQINALKINTR